MLQKKALIGVYAIVNVISQDFYIGSTFAGDGIVGRLNRHFWLLQSGKHANQFLQNSYNKYGEDAFIAFPIEIVEEAKDVRAREKFWFTELKPPFNLIKVGDGEEIYSDETRAKLAKPFQEYNASLKGKPASEKRIAQLEAARQAYREQGVSQETRDKLSQSLSNREITWKDKIAQSHQGKVLSKEHKQAIGKGVSEHEYSEDAKRRLGWNKGGNLSDAAKQKISDGFTDEGKKRIAEAAKKRWEKFRAEKALKQQQDNTTE